jgi:hypothetical protein
MGWFPENLLDGGAAMPSSRVHRPNQALILQRFDALLVMLKNTSTIETLQRDTNPTEKR